MLHKAGARFSGDCRLRLSIREPPEGGAVATRANAARQGTVCWESLAPVDGTGDIGPRKHVVRAQGTINRTIHRPVISTTQVVPACFTPMPWPLSVATVTFPSFCLGFLWRKVPCASARRRKFQIDSWLLAVVRGAAISGRGVDAELRLFSLFTYRIPCSITLFLLPSEGKWCGP